MAIGLRIEVAAGLIKDFNKIQQKFNGPLVSIDDYYKYGKVSAKVISDVVSAQGKKDKYKKSKTSNFCILNHNIKESEIIRISKIINTLGNGRIIRESIMDLINKKSVLSGLPEIYYLSNYLKKLNTYIPGMLNAGYYYSPCVEF